MNIYIDNEEVLCDRNLVIKEELSNANSIILNNVYPKSWEIDKDYVSRFYMPKDYSSCLITDGENPQEIDLSNNFYTKNNRGINFDTSIIGYRNYYSVIQYIPVVPNKTYKLKVKKSTNDNYQYIYETDSLDVETIATRLQITSTQGTYTYTITPTHKYIVVTMANTAGVLLEMLSLEIITTDNVLFSGYIKNSGNISLNPRYPHYSTLQALEWGNFLSEGDVLDYIMPSMKVSDVLKRLVRDIDGFFIGEIKIDSDDVLGTYNCADKTPHDILEYLAEITGGIWYTRAIADKVTLVDFYSPGQLLSETPIDYTEEYFCQNNIDDISYSYNAQDYRNKQVISNNEAIAGAEQVETKTYEGTSIKLTYPVGKIVSIKNGTTPYSFATKQSGVSAYFIYEYGSNEIEVNQNVTTGNIFTITYYPIVNVREIAYNQDEIDRITDVVSGVISRYEKRTDTNDTIALNQIAQTYIEFKSVPEVIIKIRTHEKDLFDLGTQVLFNAPIESLVTNYLVKSKTIEKIVTGNQVVTFYEYQLSSSFNDENFINFFDNQRRKLIGNLGEDEYVTKHIDIPTQTNIIFYGAELTKIEELPVNTLNAGLDIEI